MLGTAMVLMPVTTAALNELPRSLIPHGTAMNNTMRQVAASMGTAVPIEAATWRIVLFIAVPCGINDRGSSFSAAVVTGMSTIAVPNIQLGRASCRERV